MLTAGERLEALMLQDQLMQSHSGVLSEAKDLWFRILRYREENGPDNPYVAQTISRMIDVLVIQVESLKLPSAKYRQLLELWREQYEASK